MTRVRKINGTHDIPFIKKGNTFGVTIHILENKIPEDFYLATNRNVVLRCIDEKGIIVPTDIVWDDHSLSFIVLGKSQKLLGRYIAEVSYEKAGATFAVDRIWDGIIFSLVEHSWQQNFPRPGNLEIPILEISGIIQFGQDGDPGQQGDPGRDGIDGKDGAQIIEVANEAEAIERSKDDTKNFYVWASQ